MSPIKSKKTEFITYLSQDTRRRHKHTRVGKKITNFSVQVEILIENDWKPVVRYDTAHGFAHRDLIRPSGRVDKTPLFLHTWSEALDFSEADLKANWQAYVD